MIFGFAVWLGGEGTLKDEHRDQSRTLPAGETEFILNRTRYVLSAIPNIYSLSQPFSDRNSA